MNASAPEPLRSEPWLDGLCFPEGLRWHRDALYFSDVLHDRVMYVRPGDSVAETLFELPGRPSGLAFRADGSLLVATMQARHLHRFVPGGGVATLTDLGPYAPRVLNDMTIDPLTGNAYVDAYGHDDTEGAIVLVRPDGDAEVATDEVEYPNGMLVVPGTHELVVADTNQRRLLTFEILDDGRLRPGADFAAFDEWVPDGICVDVEGAVWMGAVHNGRFLRVERGGTVTHSVETPGRWALTCVLGGPDGRTLFMGTAETDRERFGAGDARGWIITAEAPVPGAK